MNYPILRELRGGITTCTQAVCRFVLLMVLVVHAGAVEDDFNFDWRFAPGDQSAAVQSEFDDSEWQRVDLPHDWAIHQDFDPQGDPNTGLLEWKGEGWYRKRFDLYKDAAGKRLQFTFDGVMSSPTVYLNGKKVGAWVYGYNSFVIDATHAAHMGAENVLVVHADTRAHGSRWYPGAGIYRKVSMRLVNAVHIPVWGVYVTTPSVTDAAAQIKAEVQVANTTKQHRVIGIAAKVVGPNGQVVAERRERVTVNARQTVPVNLEFAVDQPMRWDVEHPHLYTLQTELYFEGNLTDTQTTHFGIRTFEWTADDGFHLNGRRLDLQGVNEHHTHGMLGAAFFPRAMERKLEILKDMGVNALRTSHNAEAPEVLALCDRMGIVVFNELFDKWDATAGVDVKTAEYVAEYAEREVKNFVLRDRNHPSVFLWSISNEDGAVLGNRDGRSAEHVTKVVGFFKKYDPTRPTTIGCHMSGAADPGKGIFDAVDTSGWNYGQRYMNFRENYPDKPIIYSETASAFATRGAYQLQLPRAKTDFSKDGHENAFVLTGAAWGDIPEPEFERMRKHRYLNGDFVWSGFDYLGEPTPHRGGKSGNDGPKARSSYFGIIDLAGLPKDTYYLYRSQWLKTEDTVHLTPHWNWETGDQVPVIVYTNGDEAELFLNGQSLGRKKKTDPDSLKADNMAFGRDASASSIELKQDAGGNVLEDNVANKAFDGDRKTKWCASDGSFPQYLQVDLGAIKTFSRVNINWEGQAREYQYRLLVSDDNEHWTPVKGKTQNRQKISSIALQAANARYLKLEITGHKNNSWACLYEMEVLESDGPWQNPYFDIVDAYRLRWMGIPFEAGELKAVAYQEGQRIGEATVKTAGAPAALRLSADRTELQADGMDLCYVTVEMIDANGTVCPRAMDALSFEVEGAASLMGVANGDQLGMDSLTDASHPLFYGKAVGVLRSLPGEAGPATLTVTSASGQSQTVMVTFQL